MSRSSTDSELGQSSYEARVPRGYFGHAQKSPVVIQPGRQRTAYRELMTAVAEHKEEVPCLTTPDLDWLSEDHAEANAAAEACKGCSAFAECAEYVRAHPQHGGVWAGKKRHDQRHNAKESSKP